MELKKKSFIKSGNPSIASYNWTDAEEGTGVVQFYGFTSATSTTNPIYGLSSTASYSDQPSTTETQNHNNIAYDETFLDLDFDLSEFNTPRIIRGTAYAYITWSNKHSTSVGNGSSQVLITIRKWDGSTETDIATATSKTITASGASTKTDSSVVPITIPKTAFSIGETLRVNVSIRLWAGEGGASEEAVFYHDPMDVGTTGDHESFIVNIPFELDL